jgi:hypothetical protein
MRPRGNRRGADTSTCTVSALAKSGFIVDQLRALAVGSVHGYAVCDRDALERLIRSLGYIDADR